MAKIQVKRGKEANLGSIALEDGEFAITTDTKKLYVGIGGSKVLLGGASSLGDMLKSIYDTNNDGIVDNADKLDGKHASEFANSSHDHNSLISISRKSGNDLPSTWPIGLYMSEVYNNGFPCSYGNCLTMKSSSSAITQICMEWKGSDTTIGSMWIRNKRDTGVDKFSDFREFTFSGHTHTKSNITDMPTKLSQFNNDIGFITKKDIDTSSNHIHSNKGVLDKITQGYLDNWNDSVSLNYDKYIPEKSTAGTHNTKLLDLTCSFKWHRIAETFIVNSRSGSAIITLKATSSDSTLFTDYSINYIALNTNGYYIIDRIKAGLIFASNTVNKIELWFSCSQWSESLAISRLHTNGGSPNLNYYDYSFVETTPIFTNSIIPIDVYAKANHNHDNNYIKKGMTWNELEGV